MKITDVQQARAIIGSVGEPHQKVVADKLQATYYDMPADDLAYSTLMAIELAYVLNVANELWIDQFDRIPQYIKDYDKEE